MIFTHAIASGAAPDEQNNAHGLVFSSNTYSLVNTNTNPPSGMTGFQEANLNPECPYAYMLFLRFSANPTNWRVQMQASNFLDHCTTWNGNQVGNLAGDLYTAQPSNASQAVNDHNLILLVPQIAAGIDQLTITLGNTEQSQLVSANFHRVIAMLHPTPAIGARYRPSIITEKGIDGSTFQTLSSLDPKFEGEVNIEAWKRQADLSDLDTLSLIPDFAVWPCGLETEFTRTQAIEYRRPGFARNCTVTRTSGVYGHDMLDTPEGPNAIRFSFKETS